MNVETGMVIATIENPIFLFKQWSASYLEGFVTILKKIDDINVPAKCLFYAET